MNATYYYQELASSSGAAPAGFDRGIAQQCTDEDRGLTWRPSLQITGIRRRARTSPPPHRAGVIHRDLKPANVKLRPEKAMGPPDHLRQGNGGSPKPRAEAEGGHYGPAPATIVVSGS